MWRRNLKLAARVVGVAAACGAVLALAGTKAPSCVPAEPSDPVCAGAGDCEGLPHAECKGAWGCEGGACVWKCEATTQDACTSDAQCPKGEKCLGQSIYCFKAPCPQPPKQCVAETFCWEPSDCENLPHIECVGQWNCTSSACNYTCGGSGGPKLQWYLTCGAPVCKGWTPNPDVPLCTGEKVGAACADATALCDPKDACGALLTCTDVDPKSFTCPKSAARFKTQIDYLSPADIRKIAADVHAMRLATWRYTGADDDGRQHTGFVIDDLRKGSPAVAAPGDRVDLYGYTSMAVAALQSQATEIAALREELRELRSMLPAQQMCGR